VADLVKERKAEATAKLSLLLPAPAPIAPPNPPGGGQAGPANGGGTGKAGELPVHYVLAANSSISLGLDRPHMQALMGSPILERERRVLSGQLVRHLQLLLQVRSEGPLSRCFWLRTCIHTSVHGSGRVGCSNWLKGRWCVVQAFAVLTPHRICAFAVYVRGLARSRP
jgi:hypothetical protein